MKRAIPQFSAKDINKLEDYERFRNLKSYLLQKAGSINRAYVEKEEIWKLAGAVGYSKYNKFLNHREQWHELVRKIPVSYLDIIGVDYDVLDFTVELDQKDYQSALQIPLYPKGFIVRHMSCFYRTVEFLPDTPENQAIEIVQEYARKEGKKCAINYADIKTILVGTEGQVNTCYYEPNINFVGGYMIASSDGQTFATVRGR